MFKYLVVVSLCGLTLGNVCPPADKLAPCACDEKGKTIFCVEIESQVDIKAVFDRVAPLVKDSTVFDSLSIGFTNLTEIPENAIATLKFRNIDVSGNQN